jgi:beta-glucosidase
MDDVRPATPRRIELVLALLALVLAAAWNDRDAARAERWVFQDASRPVAERVADLVSRMTLEEKVSQLMNSAAAIPRLGVPEYDWWNEALHGVARAGLATSFPQAIGLAAAWDEGLLGRVATVISDEARAKHHAFAAAGKRGLYQGLTFWSPNINIFRDPRWGRGMETYGEDPYLAGRLAVAFVRGMQGDDPRYLKTIATPKHYAVHSGPEPDRHVFDAVVDERDLRDTYLPQFEMAVREGGALSVMCAYNRLGGDPCCASPRLLTDILRTEWGFAGYVVSDCGAIDDIYRTHKLVRTPAEASAMAVKAGCDLECGSSFRSLTDAVRQGRIGERELDVAVRRLFTARFRLGMFDPPAAVRWAAIPYGVVDSVPHREQALRAARESIVLLKNDRDTLPIGPGIRTLAVIGPNAADVEVLLGNYNGTPKRPVTILDGIRAGAPSGAAVVYERGAPLAEGMPALEVVPASALWTVDGGASVNGLKGEYFTPPVPLSPAERTSWLSSTLPFPSFDGPPAFTRIDPVVDFNWWEGSPDPRLPDDDNFAIRWTGEIAAPVSGRYALGASAMTGVRLFVDGRLVTEYKSRHEPARQYGWVQLEAGRRYPVRLEYFQRMRDAHVSLLWQVPDPDLEKKAVAAASKADLVVMVLGLSPRLEGEEMRVPVPGFEGGDRSSLDLPASQQHLLEAVTAAGKPVVLVLLNGSAVACTWADQHVPAIVEAWYPGQAGGTAVADVLFGRYNPGGRLPITVYRSVSDLPPFGDYRMAGRTYRYFKGEALYPFGHGLSYTTFQYDRLAVGGGEAPATGLVRLAARGPIPVSVDVKNTGRREGDEVVQVYVSKVGAPPGAPIRALKAFRRVTLAAGETRRVAFTLGEKDLAETDANGKAVVTPGLYDIAVGGRQPGLPGRAAASTTGVAAARVEVR